MNTVSPSVQAYRDPIPFAIEGRADEPLKRSGRQIFFREGRSQNA